MGDLELDDGEFMEFEAVGVDKKHEIFFAELIVDFGEGLSVMGGVR